MMVITGLLPTLSNGYHQLKVLSFVPVVDRLDGNVRYTLMGS